jgi:YD repeat-containing protein
VTTLGYSDGADPLRITSVTDPFGRTATFTYNALGQLETITDVIGLASRTADGGLWFPGLNDCHSALDDCVQKVKQKRSPMENPGAPGGRVGPPCDPCDKKKK